MKIGLQQVKNELKTTQIFAFFTMFCVLLTNFDVSGLNSN